MIHALKPLTNKPIKTEHGLALEDPAVAHCQRTWERVYSSVLRCTRSKALAHLEASVAFREALPRSSDPKIFATSSPALVSAWPPA
jgi:hypothetical protein